MCISRKNSYKKVSLRRLLVECLGNFQLFCFFRCLQFGTVKCFVEYFPQCGTPLLQCWFNFICCCLFSSRKRFQAFRFFLPPFNSYMSPNFTESAFQTFFTFHSSSHTQFKQPCYQYLNTTVYHIFVI